MRRAIELKRESCHKDAVAIGLSCQGNASNLNSTAPRVCRIGRESASKEVLREARRYGIPTVRDEGLANTLGSLSLDNEIPEELYESVAAYFVKFRVEL